MTRHSSIDKNTLDKIVSDLKSRGFTEIAAPQKPQKKQYLICSHTGDEASFGVIRKYDISWQE